MSQSAVPSVRDVYDQITHIKMAPAWTAVFLVWLGGSISLLVKYGLTIYDIWYLIYLTGLIGIPSGVIGLHMFYRSLIKRERKLHKMRSSNRS